MRYKDFVCEVARRSGHHPEEIRSMMSAATQVLSAALEREERVSIAGLGIFALKARAERMARNPQTGEPVWIAARRDVAFKPGARLKRRVESATAPMNQVSPASGETCRGRGDGRGIETETEQTWSTRDSFC